MNVFYGFLFVVNIVILAVQIAVLIILIENYIEWKIREKALKLKYEGK